MAFFHKRLSKNVDGFTLIEIVGVMLIIGVLSSMAAAKVFDTDTLAKEAALEAAVSDLNSRERLTWSRIKMSNDNWLDDAQVFGTLDTELGAEYHWESIAHTGGSLNFKGFGAALTRSPSTSGQPGVWKIK